MIEVGSFRALSHAGVTRRAFVQAAFAAPFLPLAARGLAAAEKTLEGPAKSVILLWLWGGPSHLDTFDPKPEAPIEIRGPFRSEWLKSAAFGRSAMPVSRDGPLSKPRLLHPFCRLPRAVWLRPKRHWRGRRSR